MNSHIPSGLPFVPLKFHSDYDAKLDKAQTKFVFRLYSHPLAFLY